MLILIQTYGLVAVCLQELSIPDSYTFHNRNYSLYSSLPTQTGNRPFGGTGILVSKNLPNSFITINTTSQAVACRFSTPQPITLCSICLPPSSTWNSKELLSLVVQLPSPIIFMCDFNAHNILCGCTANDKKWQEVCDFVLSSNLCLLNHKVPTYIHPATGSRSSLDFAFCDLSLFMEFSWMVHDDLCRSDNFPIILNQVKVSPTQETQR
jgi:Endonuclease-reverse transcriptase